MCFYGLGKDDYRIKFEVLNKDYTELKEKVGSSSVFNRENWRYQS